MMHPAVACLPPGIVAPIPSPSAAGGGPNAARIPAATVFLDISGSMAGYVAPPRAPASVPTRPSARPTRPASPPAPAEIPEPRTFRDLVLSLPQLLASISDQPNLHVFGRVVRPLPLSELPRAGRPDFYRESESRIQEALARIDALPAEELGLLVTDLFLTGEEIFGGASAIRAPLGRILESGRSVGLMGIRSGFAGTIYDIPGGRTYDGASERPFFLVATGPGAAVARFFRRVETEILAPLPPTADGQPRSYATIFSRTPFTSGPLPLALVPNTPAIAAPTLVANLGPEIRRVSFPGAAGMTTASLPLRDLAIGPVLLPDLFQVEETVWAEAPGGRSRAGCDGRWIPIRSLPASLASLSSRDTATDLTVGGPALSRVPPGLPFLLHARVTAMGLSESPVATAWTRTWNLEAREAEAFVASRPRLFRTLHLREVTAMLEGLVRENLLPHPIGEAILAFQVTRR